ncbi:MAG: hypothetical protein [Olavius algarvensis Gamma 1 endosymbiont]|nr:MAG: hypothetical protein [Olavius algarvensis Gamma 1 endosymbiont]
MGSERAGKDARGEPHRKIRGSLERARSIEIRYYTILT